jgi:hypothetical protein
MREVEPCQITKLPEPRGDGSWEILENGDYLSIVCFPQALKLRWYRAGIDFEIWL